jgi:hypothetical protein
LGLLSGLGAGGTGGLDALAPMWNLVQSASSAAPFIDNMLNTIGKYAKIETMEPQLRKEAKRERLWYGPFTLPAFDVSFTSQKDASCSYVQ